MQDIALRLRMIWPFFTLLASGGMLAAAHAFERFGGLAPCPLCLDQREWHWAALAASATGIALVRLFSARAWIAAALLGVVYAGSAWSGAHHVAVEQGWIVAQCVADLDLNNIQPLDFEGSFEAPSCDTPAWTLFGISMAGYNALISAALMLVSFAIAFAPARKPAHG